MSIPSSGSRDPAPDAGWEDAPARKGFFTDTSICIGCKACEVACKEWNAIPEDGLSMLGSSYDNTGALGASTWRHVAFIEQSKPLGRQETGVGRPPVDLGMPSFAPPAACRRRGRRPGRRRRHPHHGRRAAGVPVADVLGRVQALHHAACLDVCPTGSLFRTEFGTVVVQDDICNGCGYCVPACPFGVIERRSGPEGAKNVGIAQKCTLCYDRLGAGQTPACAQACPTQSIQFGDLDELRERAQARVETLQAAGVTDARLYGENPDDGIGGAGAMFLLLDEPEVYGLPPDPVVTTRDLPHMWRRAGLAAATLLAGAVAVFVGGAS